MSQLKQEARKPLSVVTILVLGIGLGVATIVGIQVHHVMRVERLKTQYEASYALYMKSSQDHIDYLKWEARTGLRDQSLYDLGEKKDWDGGTRTFLEHLAANVDTNRTELETAQKSIW